MDTPQPGSDRGGGREAIAQAGSSPAPQDAYGESKTTTGKPTTLQHTLASQCGSAASTIVLYPIDVVRVRFMSQDGTQVRQHSGQTYSSVARSFKVIHKSEGLRAFYGGCHVAVLGSVCSWGIYMYSYRWLCDSYALFKERPQRRSCDPSAGRASVVYSERVDTFLQRFALSTLASCVCAVACNPIWLMKTRMQIEEASRASQVERRFRTFRGGLLYSVRASGVKSLWRGTSAQVLLGVPNAVTLPLYDTMKAYLKQLHQDHGAELNLAEVSLASFTTKVMVALIAHPIAVFKTRLQDHRARVGDVQYTSFLQTAKTIWKRSGPKGLYRGFVPSLYQSVPRTVLMFVFYERFLRFFTKVLPAS